MLRSKPLLSSQQRMRSNGNFGGASSGRLHRTALLLAATAVVVCLTSSTLFITSGKRGGSSSETLLAGRNAEDGPGAGARLLTAQVTQHKAVRRSRSESNRLAAFRFRTSALSSHPSSAAGLATPTPYHPATHPAANASPPPPSTSKKHQKQVVFRHGARTPLSTAFFNGLKWTCDESYPNAARVHLVHSATGGPPPPLADPAPPKLPGGCPQGTLTLTGFKMAVDLGRDLRSRYVDDLGLLPAEHAAGSVFAHTTNYRRTIATLRVRL
jgi:hypothetical protein